MARYPHAVWRPLPENDTEPAITPTQVILHSAVSSAESLCGFFGREDVRVESHFYVREDGTVEQMIDTSRQADANYRANSRAISIETWDGGDPDHRPWNDAQLAALTALVRWLCGAHSIPKRACQSDTDPGIGYHSQFRSWSPVIKTCPGLARRPQVPQIIAAVAGGTVPSAPVPRPTPKPDGGVNVAALPLLRRGAKGADVRRVQGLLLANGVGVGRAGIDGDFGPRTESAVHTFQSRAGIGVDGIVGPITWSRLLGV